MKSIISLFTALLVTLPWGAQALAPFVNDNSADVIPNSYIVMMKSDVSEKEFESHLGRTDSVLRTNNAVRKRAYSFEGFRGYSVEVPHGVATSLANNDRVAYIEADQIYHLSYEESEGLIEGRDLDVKARPLCCGPFPWNIDRITHRRANTSTPRWYDDSAGAGSYIYVLDTGIDTSHRAFEGRASLGYNAVGGRFEDSNGHGTHIAGVAGGSGFSATAKPSLVAVKIMEGSSASCTYQAYLINAIHAEGITDSIILDGINWAVNDIVSKGRQSSSAVLLAFSGGYSQTLSNALKSASSKGVFFAVASGDKGTDASNAFPCSEPTTCCAGGTNIQDQVSSFSNYGASVDIFAPAQDINSTWLGGTTKFISGTAGGAAHLASASVYLRRDGFDGSSATLCNYIKSRGSKNVLSGVPSGTSNLLLYIGSEN